MKNGKNEILTPDKMSTKKIAIINCFLFFEWMPEKKKQVAVINSDNPNKSDMYLFPRFQINGFKKISKIK